MRQLLSQVARVGPSATARRVLGGAVVVLLVTACGDPEPLEGRTYAVHPAGWGEAGGHARALRADGYPLDTCYACHALDEGPGNCVECHAEGPEACDVCHAEPPAPHAAHARFDCATCHPVPGDLRTAGHLEDRGSDDVTLRGLAATRGFDPSYSAEGAGCSQVACHAGPGARRPVLEWGAAPVICGDCHGVPPPDHPADRCDRCHEGIVDADGRVVLDEARHIDGRVEALDWRGLDCDGCHGQDGDPAPPRALDGSSDTASRGVGAHQAHLQPTNAKPVACGTCHVVPAAVDVPGHVDDDTPGRAEVVLTGPAVGDAGQPVYAAARCSDTACHGPDQPVWTGDAPCGSCHALPPAAPHPVGTDCTRCHSTAGPDRTIARPLNHVDGRVDVLGLGPDDCVTCHGEGGRVVPGGSHAAHARFDCAACHPVPQRPVEPGPHLDGAPTVDLAAGGVFDGRGCAQVGCHGFGEPEWGVPETVQGCDACHGAPPPGHAVGDCTQCHPGPMEATHVDGRVQVALPQACDACHGYPPDSGAHVAHLSGERGKALDCATCHVVPDRVDAPGHLDPPPAEVALQTGRYAEGGCAETDCHAGPAAEVPEPQWDDPPSVADCGGCHAVPPPEHPPQNCVLCHGGVIDVDGVITRPRLHVDGEVTFR